MTIFKVIIFVSQWSESRFKIFIIINICYQYLWNTTIISIKLRRRHLRVILKQPLLLRFLALKFLLVFILVSSARVLLLWKLLSHILQILVEFMTQSLIIIEYLVYLLIVFLQLANLNIFIQAFTIFKTHFRLALQYLSLRSIIIDLHQWLRFGFSLLLILLLLKALELFLSA